MPQIDRERIQSNARQVFQANGETAILRKYVSASAGTPKFGMGDQYQYMSAVVITALFHGHHHGGIPRERQQPGGISMAAHIYCTTVTALAQQDELIWRGTAYRMDGASTPQVLGGRVQWQNPLILAGTTGA